jgi:soluble lytic murein transglycosylase-like protein
MLRTATALVCAALAITALTASRFTGLNPPSTAMASVAETATESAAEPVGRVRATRRSERFDPFGEIVPLPVFTMEQFRRPAFDPALYRGGRVGEPLAFDDLCEVVQDAADEFAIPFPLFARLIWQESRFRNEVVSRAGAQGIAQFMPRTAELRGLEDPFDPLEALPASADFLRELVKQFGNFGLAAAAYNGGPTRVRNWLAGRMSRLPKETQDYVLRITGKPVEHWRRQGAKPHPSAFDVKDCRVKPIRALASD